ncbi:MAG: Crp/Fnr family transcriptional regulator [Candidatus Hydrogenedentota bacterium]
MTTTPINNLAAVPFLALLDDNECRALGARLQSKSYQAGEEIFAQGQPGDSFYIVKSGRVKIFIESGDGEEIVLTESKAGDAFGEISLFDGGPRTATAVAASQAELLWLDRGRLLDFLSDFPHAALDLMAFMGRRLRETDELLRVIIARKPESKAAEENSTFDQISRSIRKFLSA